MTPLERHLLVPDVDVHLTGRDPAGPSAAIDSDDNLSPHRPHQPERLAHARARVATATATDLDRWVTMRQVHGADVATVEGSRGGEVRGVDAIVTRTRDLALVVMTADCVPVLIAGETSVAAAHAGWRGVVAGIVESTVARMRELDGPRARLTALVGPAIGGCCYEVGPEVIEAIDSVSPAAVTTSVTGRPSVDLGVAVRETLAALDVRVAERRPSCTRCVPGWFSHRADPRAGRQAGLIVRRASEPA